MLLFTSTLLQAIKSMQPESGLLSVALIKIRLSSSGSGITGQMLITPSQNSWLEEYRIIHQTVARMHGYIISLLFNRKRQEHISDVLTDA